jgi:hypothetical protein
MIKASIRQREIDQEESHVTPLHVHCAILVVIFDFATLKFKT